MSRLHRQKLRLRSQQRADGLIEPDARQVDRDAFQEVGSSHAAAREALELVKRHGADAELPADTTTQSQTARLPASTGVLERLSPAELEEVRAHLERRNADQPAARPAMGGTGAQNPPL